MNGQLKFLNMVFFCSNLHILNVFLAAKQNGKIIFVARNCVFFITLFTRKQMLFAIRELQAEMTLGSFSLRGDGAQGTTSIILYW